MHGELKGGYEDLFCPINTFKGKLLNPAGYTSHSSPLRPVGKAALLALLRDKILGHTPLLLSKSHQKGCSYRKLQVAAHNKTRQTKNFFDLPIEIRCIIYDYACGEWDYKPFLPVRPARLNPGAGLLLTCKQVAAEATPSVYRNFRIHSGDILNVMSRLGDKIAHIRELEIHFSCFCPSGARNLRYNNGTLFASNPDGSPEDLEKWLVHLPSGYIPDHQTLEKLKHTWTTVMSHFQSLHGLAELAVTFQTCTRSVSYQPLWRLSDIDNTLLNGVIAPHRRFCVALENHFLDLLTGCRRVDRISLLVNVPPSLPVRLAQPHPGCGMSVQAVRTTMANFVKKTEEASVAWKAGTEHWPGLPWENFSNPFPSDIEHPTLFPVPHFVLAREGTARGRWEANVASEEGGQLLAGMEVVVGSISTMTLEEMRQFMDCDGEIREPEVEQ